MCLCVWGANRKWQGLQRCTHHSRLPAFPHCHSWHHPLYHPPHPPQSPSSAWHFYLCSVVTCHSLSCLLAHHLYWHKCMCMNTQRNAHTCQQHAHIHMHVCSHLVITYSYTEQEIQRCNTTNMTYMSVCVIYSSCCEKKNLFTSGDKIQSPQVNHLFKCL